MEKAQVLRNPLDSLLKIYRPTLDDDVFASLLCACNATNILLQLHFALRELTICSTGSVFTVGGRKVSGSKNEILSEAKAYRLRQSGQLSTAFNPSRMFIRNLQQFI